uniref:Uncharacterized protein n=1 Tax=Rhizophora mucronata TaxID=61149 RepID=A0A2P2IJI6_RHIMU
MLSAGIYYRTLANIRQASSYNTTMFLSVTK